MRPKDFFVSVCVCVCVFVCVHTAQYLLAAALITIQNVLFFDLVHIMLHDPRSWVALFYFWDEDGICFELCKEHNCTEKCRPYLSGVTAASK